MDINNVELIGRVTRDATLKTVGASSLLEFSIAVGYKTKKDGAWIDAVNFFEIDLWGKAAEALSKHVTKGKQLGISGELRQDRWLKEGQTKSKIKVIARQVQLLGDPRGSQSDGHDPADPRQDQGSKTPPDDDIPF